MNIRKYQGTSPALAPDVYVDPSAVVIGDVQMGAGCSVWPNATIRGDMHKIRIGERCSIQDNSCLHITHASQFHPEGFPLTLGDEVTVGHTAVLHGCTIGSRVLIGISCVVLDGAVIENDVILGAGSLVPPNKRLESGWLYLGSPAKPIRGLTKDEYILLTYGPKNYLKLQKTFREDQDNQ